MEEEIIEKILKDYGLEEDECLLLAVQIIEALNAYRP
jgi:hypothetical protein